MQAGGATFSTHARPWLGRIYATLQAEDKQTGQGQGTHKLRPSPDPAECTGIFDFFSFFFVLPTHLPTLPTCPQLSYQVSPRASGTEERTFPGTTHMGKYTTDTSPNSESRGKATKARAKTRHSFHASSHAARPCWPPVHTRAAGRSVRTRRHIQITVHKARMGGNDTADLALPRAYPRLRPITNHAPSHIAVRQIYYHCLGCTCGLFRVTALPVTTTTAEEVRRGLQITSASPARVSVDHPPAVYV